MENNMSKLPGVIKAHASNLEVPVLIGLAVALMAVLAEALRRRIQAGTLGRNAFIEKLRSLLFAPAAEQPLSCLSFAATDIFDVKRRHEVADGTSAVVTALLGCGATCVGKAVMDELSMGITYENVRHGTPVNPQMLHFAPRGSSSGSAMSVAANIVDFAVATDAIGGVRVPAAFCGVFGYRPSHGSISMDGAVSISPSLDTIGWFASNPSVLHRVGHALLQLSATESRRVRRFVFADDLFELLKVLMQKTDYIITSKAIENLSRNQPPEHIDFGQYIASNVPSLNRFHAQCSNLFKGISTLKALSSMMVSLQRYEFKTNREEWVKSTKPKLRSDVSNNVLTAAYENVELLYKVMSEMRDAIGRLLKDDGILVIPMVGDPPLKRNTEKEYSSEFQDRTLILSSIASLSGCCQVVIPLKKRNDRPLPVSLLSFHGADKFLLDTVVDIYSSLYEIISNSSLWLDTSVKLYSTEDWIQEGNVAFEKEWWTRAIHCYSEAIFLNGTNSTYYANRAAAFMKLPCLPRAEEDWTKAIALDGKNVKAYLNRGKVREWLRRREEAFEDFERALVLEPHNKVTEDAVEKLRKWKQQYK